MSRLEVERGESTSDIFGTRGESWAQDIETRPNEVLPPFTREPWAEASLIPNEVVDIRKLRLYAPHGTDRRQGGLKRFIQIHETPAGCPNGENARHQRYAEKLICGRATGRLYSMGASMQTITREAMEAACAKGFLEVDISN